MLGGYSAVVTGATEGIGRGIALALGKAGAGVVVTGLDSAAAARVADEICTFGGQSVGAACDVTKRADLERAIDLARTRFGRLDALVHNANNTGAGSASVESLTDADWDACVSVGLRPIFLSARTALAALAESQGSMVVLTSQSGIDGSPTLPAYSAVKGAQRAMVKSLAREWGPLGVRVNALAPSAVTPALAAYLEREPHMRTHIVNRSPLRRTGDSELDIGAAIAFLVGPNARFVTGQTLVVNGGALMM